ncbi:MULTISPECIES: hypothetical protein [unclassified Cellulophaga]|uniref:hypothetical protein n=1 Tax=unclassified Cellulophaga TaxID=2634405 RepID=UPI00051DF3CA|nr:MULTISPECIES: hypothetical protein [unclassified Cellulophaga]KGK29176.1 hypothetical protein EL45_18180 [Cellulophaga sp. E6(2014)]
MPRINSSKYESEIIDAYEVDDQYDSFKKDKFKCPECNVQIQFNRGINAIDPHFKNWPKKSHLSNCEILKIHKQHNKGNNNDIEVLISTILPRAERLQKLNSIEKIRKARNRYFGKRSKQFLNSLTSISYEELKNLTIRTENKTTVKIIDLIMRQDEIINKLNSNDESFVCILKGYTTKAVEIGENIKIPMTFGGKYGNSQKFDLFIPSSYKSKNDKNINKIENKLIYCYGLPEKNEYGSKIDLFSITHQVAIIER